MDENTDKVDLEKPHTKKHRQQSETAMIVTHFIENAKCDTFHRKRKRLGEWPYMASCLKPMESKKKQIQYFP